MYRNTGVVLCVDVNTYITKRRGYVTGPHGVFKTFGELTNRLQLGNRTSLIDLKGMSSNCKAYGEATSAEMSKLFHWETFLD